MALVLDKTGALSVIKIKCFEGPDGVVHEHHIGISKKGKLVFLDHGTRQMRSMQLDAQIQTNEYRYGCLHFLSAWTTTLFLLKKLCAYDVVADKIDLVMQKAFDVHCRNKDGNPIVVPDGFKQKFSEFIKLRGVTVEKRLIQLMKEQEEANKKEKAEKKE